MTDTERLDKFDRWLQSNGWTEGGKRVRFMDENFEGHVRDFIDGLPEPLSTDVVSDHSLKT